MPSHPQNHYGPEMQKNLRMTSLLPIKAVIQEKYIIEEESKREYEERRILV